jgi:transposase InsO family protein
VLAEHDMKIAPQTYYRRLACPVSAAEWEQAHLVNEIVDIYRRNRCVYGVRKMWHAARRAGLRLGRDQVGQLMRIAGIQGVRRGSHRTTTTIRDERAARHPDLVKRAWSSPTRPDALWCADFTYVWTAAGFCYVSFITDVYSRRILGWRVSLSKTTDLVTAALAQSLATRRRASSSFTAQGLIHHSDAGSQGGFNWSSQHLDCGGVCGQTCGLDESVDWSVSDEVAGGAGAAA